MGVVEIQLNLIFIFLLSIIAIIISIFFNTIRTKNKIRQEFYQANYSKKTIKTIKIDLETMQCIRGYWDSKNKYDNSKYSIDDTTWNDLDMDNIFSMMNLNQSSVGEEYLSQNIEAKIDILCILNNLGNSIANKTGGQFEEIIDYFKIITMWDFINYNKIINILTLHTQEFHTLYKIIGRLDSAISIQLFRKSLDFYSKPKFYDDNEIIIKDLYHPLIQKPVYNSLNWDRNIILTGSNASGKSTLIKALSINMICSQTIFTCFCSDFCSKMSFIITSMTVKDNLNTNESYFVAEIKSLKRILDNINENIRCVCFVDEILKGTNTVERISASSSILNWLSYKNCLVMVASHDIELTEILEKNYNNFHFREQILDEGIYFDYKIYKGSSQTKNAISLLNYMGFDKEIVINATQISETFQKNRIWDKFK